MSLPISQVTVHRDAAMVVRRGTIEATQPLVHLRGLPLLLDEASLRARVAGTDVVDVQLCFDLEGLERADNSQAALNLAEALAAMQLLSVERTALVQERDWLATTRPQLDDDTPLPSPQTLLFWTTLDTQVEPWARSVDERIRTLDTQLRGAQERVDACRAEVEAMSSQQWWRRWAPTRVAILHLADEVSGPLEVELSYRIPGATWTPSYRLEADATLQRGHFTMRALVTQATGEDWSAATLRLSTTSASRRTDLPPLPALRIGARQPPPRSSWRPLPADLDSLFPEDLAHTPTEAEDLAPAPVAPRRARKMAAQRSAPPAPLSAGAAPMMLASATSVPPSASAPAPAITRIAPARQDYGRFRLADHTHPPGQRGRLRPASPGDLVAECGLPPSAARHLVQVLSRLDRESRAAPQRGLPPHHTLPGPVQGVDLRFDTDAEADIPSDGRFHAVAVFTQPVTLDAHYRTVPHVDPRVFRRVRAQIHRATALIAGPVDIFVGGDLVLTSPWAGTPGGGEIHLGLGVEDALQVARNVRYDEHARGLFGGARQVETSIEVCVASALAREVRLEILSRIPVTDSDDITIEMGASEPRAKPYEGEPDGPLLKGGLCQSVRVPPGGKVVTTLAYAVKIGAKHELIGGDRRG
jgi:hypothetical protein